MLTVRGDGGRVLGFLIASTLLLAACGADGASSLAPDGTATPGATTAASVDPGASSEATPDPGATLPAEPAIPASEEPDPDEGRVEPVSADACAGSTDNQGFFAVAAQTLSWQVYCAALPDGWLVQSGSYRLGDGGTLRVAYAGPAGTRFELRQGAICAEDSSCVPSGDDLGIVPFGDREARLLSWDGGGYAAMVDGGAPLTWVAYGTGLDEATFREFVAGLLPVAAAQ